MKTNKQLIFSVGAAISILAAICVVVLRPSSDSTTVPTAPISHQQPSGGRQVDARDNPTSDSTTQAAVSSPQPTARPSASHDDSISAATTKTSLKQQDSPHNPETPQYLYRALEAPNDPYSSNAAYQWQYTKTNATSVWTGSVSNSAVIAVIDTGFALQHEDLVSQWHQNPAEIGVTTETDPCWTGTSQQKSSNGCDDDGNGYIDDWRGWNFHGRYQPAQNPCGSGGLGTYVSNNNPQAGMSGDDVLYRNYKTCYGSDAGDPFESIAHGTSVAGFAGAASNNGIGIATANWGAKIMPLQVLGDDGMGWTSDIVDAIHYAVDNGADIINLSLGGDQNDPALAGAIAYAYRHNVPVIAAAGNCGSGNEYGCDPSTPGAMSYPARYPSVIAVGASTALDERADFSSYGFGLDVLAPGAGALISPTIYRPTDATTTHPSTDPTALNYTNRYASPLYGTSFATPIVANVASLIKAYDPDATVDDVTAIIDGSARRVGAMNGSAFTNQYGHGVIDAGTIVTIASNLQRTKSVPLLAQTGNSISEGSVSAAEPMSSGCTAAANSYCTIQLKHLETGTLRFLPYAPTDATGKVGWHWPGAIADKGTWEVRAVSGEYSTQARILIHK